MALPNLPFGISSNSSKYWFTGLTTIGIAEIRCTIITPSAIAFMVPVLMLDIMLVCTQSPSRKYPTEAVGKYINNKTVRKNDKKYTL